MDLLQKWIARWTEPGIARSPGIFEGDLSSFESRFRCNLPDEHRCYFATVNGIGECCTTDNDLFSFGQFSDMQSISQHFPDRSHHLPNASRYFIFTDHSIGPPVCAISLSSASGDPSPVASVFADSDRLELEECFDSFTDFVRSYLDNRIETAKTFPRSV